MTFVFPIQSLFEPFKMELSGPENKKILFSGKFGSGKSFFLNEFFEYYKNDYFVCSLYPNKYEINSNENIVKYIKADIMLELIEKLPQKFDETEKVNFLFYTIYKIYTENQVLITAYLTNLLVTDNLDLNPFIFSVMNTISKLGKELPQFVKNFAKDKEENIKEFLNNNLHTTDDITKLINQKLQEIKKEKILLIDDLDRIDPQHIFEILNILSAHLGVNDNTNIKNEIYNGFDKIIIVADYENLTNIFHHFYGEKTDHKGYFNKFHSKEPYNFNNIEIIEKNFQNLINQMHLEDPKDFQNESYYLPRFIKIILTLAYKESGPKSINLRNILRLKNFKFQELNNINNNQPEEYTLLDFKISQILPVLHKIFDNKEYFEQTMENIKKQNISNDIKEDINYLCYSNSKIFQEHGIGENNKERFLNYVIYLSQNKLN